MAFMFSTGAREIFEQIVHEPRFRELTTIPLFSVVQISLIAFCYLILYFSISLYLQGNLSTIPMIAINGVTIYVLFTPLHDATHRTVSRNRVVNDVLGTIACFSLLPGITTRIYRYLHLEHHRYAGDKKADPDEIFVAAHPLLLPLIIATPDINWTIWYFRHWNQRPPLERLEFVLGLAFYAGYHAFFLAGPYAMEFFLCWMIPQRIGFSLVVYFFAHIQHPKDVKYVDAPFQTTVYIVCKKIFRYMLLNQSIHCVHHFLPSVPFYRYQKAWDAGQHLFESQNIPKRTLFGPIENLILPTDDMQNTLDVKVTKVWMTAENVKAYQLESGSNSEPLPDFSAGAHVDVIQKDDLVRQYSLTGSSLDRTKYLIAVKKEIDGRGGSRSMHENVEIGSTLTISTPRNNFPLNLKAKKYILVAGGIGITPIMSMAYELYQASKDFVFHICARNQENLAFSEQLKESPFHKSIVIHLDDGNDSQKFDPEEILNNYAEDSEMYICGPGGFMSWVLDIGRTKGWPDEALFSETFTPRGQRENTNVAFEVELARSGKILQVGKDDFLIDVLNKANAGVPCSCTQGICGSCITPVISGDIDHRDVILTKEEHAKGDQMCVCVGRSKGERLVLDI